MSENLYITATEARGGKSVIALGVMELLLRKVERVAFFRPIIMRKNDNDIQLLSSQFQLLISYDRIYGLTTEEVSELLGSGREGEVIEKVIEKYKLPSEEFDFVLCEGTDFTSSTAAFELDT